MISFLSNVQCLMCSDIYAFYKNQAHWGTTQGFPNRYPFAAFWSCPLRFSKYPFAALLSCSFRFPNTQMFKFGLFIKVPNIHFLYFLSFSMRFSKYPLPTILVMFIHFVVVKSKHGLTSDNCCALQIMHKLLDPIDLD